MPYSKITELMFHLIPLLDKKFVRPVGQLSKTVVTPLQCSVLGSLAEKDTTMTELANEMLMSKQQMTLIIDKLVKENLAERKHDPDDRRLIRISITPAGLQLLAVIKEKSMSVLENKFSTLDNDDQLLLYKSLTDLHRIINKLN